MPLERQDRTGGLTRREFLHTTAGTAAGLTLGSSGLSTQAAQEAGEPLAFFMVSDTHYHAQRDAPAKMQPQNMRVNERLIDTLHRLPGTPLPEQIGGGQVIPPRGVIHLGDMIDSGDKAGDVYTRMTDTEWQVYVEQFGLTGKEGKLKYPVYELHGNHDSPRQHNAAIKGIIERNPNRIGVKNLSRNGLHYSWDWDNIHFVSLGIVVGPNDNDLPISRYDAYDSLPFLIDDLDKHVGTSGRPVVLLHHIDLQRYTGPCDSTADGGSRDICCASMAATAWCGCGNQSQGISKSEWSTCDVAAFHHAIQPYNIIATFHGHLHGRRTDTWDGKRVDAAEGIRVFGSNNSGAGGGNRGLFYCCIEDEHLVVREYHSRGEHGWSQEEAVMQWTPNVWRIPLHAAANG